MATYVIGDIHGCFQTFLSLIGDLDFNPRRDRLRFVGDLVNKGPASLEMLRWAFHHRDSIDLVLGNHDLHLIRRYFGLRPGKSSDTLESILQAHDADELINWLLGQPLFFDDGRNIMIHAGLLPSWGLIEAARQAHLAHEYLARLIAIASGLRDPGFEQNERESLEALRVFTSIRCCNKEGEPEYDFTGSPNQAPGRLRPWFRFPEIERIPRRFIFGHWARLGFLSTETALCLDSACVYGGSLTAVRLDDRRRFTVNKEEPSPSAAWASSNG